MFLPTPPEYMSTPVAWEFVTYDFTLAYYYYYSHKQVQEFTQRAYRHCRSYLYTNIYSALPAATNEPRFVLSNNSLNFVLYIPSNHNFSIYVKSVERRVVIEFWGDVCNVARVC